LDDFGTGYSSLSHLNRLPIDTLKIDRSFIHDVTANEENASITRSIIALAHSLGLHVVAEGVETEAQYEFVRTNGCGLSQGFFFSQPVSAQNAESLVRSAADMRLDCVVPAAAAPAILVEA
jgi:EAL domain-containing protein (putative c-di-GMP-specific phosphodiesterase class I)